MTTTPEQLRQLAEHLDCVACEEYEGNLAPGNVSMKRLLETSIALSAAADQLESGTEAQTTMGCVCPPNANWSCQNPLCPRKPLAGFSISGGLSAIQGDGE